MIHAIAVESVFREGAFVIVKVGEDETTSDFSFAIEEDSLVDRAIWPLLDTPSVHGIVLPLAFVHGRVDFGRSDGLVGVTGYLLGAEDVSLFLDFFIVIARFFFLHLNQCSSHSDRHSTRITHPPNNRGSMLHQ